MFLLKNNYDRKSDIRYLKPAYVLANHLGLMPSFDFDNNREFHRHRYKLMAMFNFVVVFVAYMQFLLMGIDEFMKEMSETELVVDNLEYFTITLFNLYSILGSFTYNRKAWISFLQTFNDIDKLFQVDEIEEVGNGGRKAGSWFPLEFIIFNIFISFTFAFEIVIWFSYSMKPYIYYLFPRLQLYYVFVSALMIWSFARSVLRRYEHFNGTLIGERDDLQRMHRRLDSDALNAIVETRLNRIMLIYGHLNRLIQRFNDVFGWVVLILNGVVTMACLECFNLMVLSLYIIISFHYYQLISIPVVMFTLLLMMLGFFIIYVCDRINKEAYRTSQICYQMLLICNQASFYTSKFEIFTEYCTYRHAYVAAGTVFKLKRSLLLNFFGVLTTYVIVIVSFNGKKLLFDSQR